MNQAVRAAFGVAALAFAGRELAKQRRSSRVDLPGLPEVDVKKLAKQVSRIAGQVERASEDVRLASAQAKRVAAKLS
ncbi:MAG TPA: hypothetical protein VGI67_18210 [Thermoleophilaceae bacterium]|jgi:hypothetical protein